MVRPNDGQPLPILLYDAVRNGYRLAGPGEEEMGGSPSSPHHIDLNARNLFSNSTDMQRWQNTEQAHRTAIKSGRGFGRRPQKKRGPEDFPRNFFGN